MKARIVLCLMVLVISACQSVAEKPANFIDCPEQRAQVCTMIYAPVCALEKDGRYTSYSSACTACSHKEITGYQPGICATEN